MCLIYVVFDWINIWNLFLLGVLVGKLWLWDIDFDIVSRRLWESKYLGCEKVCIGVFWWIVY